MENIITRNDHPELTEGQYRLRERDIVELSNRLNKLNKRGLKLGTGSVGYSVVSEYLYRWIESNDRNGLMPGIERFAKYVIVTVTGQTPIINGWSFAATLQHEEAGNVLRTVATFGLSIPVEFRTSTPERCDHCHTARRRNDTFVLFNAETGEWKQVGRTCLRDFLGHTSPEAIAEWASLLANLDSVFGFGDEESGMGSERMPSYVAVADVLFAASIAIRTLGFVSAKKAKEDFSGELTSTATIVRSMIFPFSQAGREASKSFFEQGSDFDRNLAEKAIAWASEIPADTDSDYLWNVRLTALSVGLESRSFGIATSIIPAYQREVEKLEAAKAAASQKPSEWFGIIGKRAVYTLTVMSVKSFETMYGVTTLVMFRTADGDRAKWFASGDKTADFEIGSTLEVKGTVKAHETYKGINETVLSRVAVVKTVASSAA